jgi:glycosyltransferase involved in cell wall biosynthesis
MNSCDVDINREYPKITVVTPSYNQAPFLEATLQSVLNQEYPNLEYIVIDGGSTDGSVEIINRYAAHLAYWVSEPDRGQTDALNKVTSFAGYALMTYWNLGL